MRRPGIFKTRGLVISRCRLKCPDPRSHLRVQSGLPETRDKKRIFLCFHKGVEPSDFGSNPSQSLFSWFLSVLAALSEGFCEPNQVPEKPSFITQHKTNSEGSQIGNEDGDVNVDVNLALSQFQSKNDLKFVQFCYLSLFFVLPLIFK